MARPLQQEHVALLLQRLAALLLQMDMLPVAVQPPHQARFSGSASCDCHVALLWLILPENRYMSV